MPRARPAMSWALSISTSGFSRSPMISVDPGVEPLLHLLLVGRGQVLVGQDDDDGLERIVAGFQLRDLLARATGPGRCCVSLKASFLADTTRRTRMASSLASTWAAALRVALPWMPSACASGKKRKPLQAADVVLLDVHGAVLGDLGVRARPSPSGPSSARWCAGRRSAASAARAAHPTGCPRWRGCAPASARGRPASRRGWTRRSRCGCGRCGWRACRCRRRCGRRTPPAWRTSPAGCAPPVPSGTCRAWRPARRGSASEILR